MTVRDLDAAGRLSGAAVEVDGAASVARYIYAGFDSKVKTWLDAAEVADLRTHEISIRPTHEIGADDVLDGHAAAVSRAQQAVADLVELGMPDAVAWWTADRDIVLSNLGRALDYAAGWSEVLGVGRRGCYGDRDLLDALFEHGLCDYYWQAGATSWSGGQISAHAHIIQTTKRATVGGVQCDVNTVRPGVTDYGQWPRVEAEVALSAEDLGKIEGLIKKWSAFYAIRGAQVMVAGHSNQGYPPAQIPPFEESVAGQLRALVPVVAQAVAEVINPALDPGALDAAVRKALDGMPVLLDTDTEPTP